MLLKEQEEEAYWLKQLCDEQVTIAKKRFGDEVIDQINESFLEENMRAEVKRYRARGWLMRLLWWLLTDISSKGMKLGLKVVLDIQAELRAVELSPLHFLSAPAKLSDADSLYFLSFLPTNWLNHFETRLRRLWPGDDQARDYLMLPSSPMKQIKKYLLDFFNPWKSKKPISYLSGQSYLQLVKLQYSLGIENMKVLS